MDNKKLKLGFLNPISSEWVPFFTNNQIEQVSRVDDADYIIYESNGDPVHVIMKIKATFPKNKLVFILSGDQSMHIDNECIWFTNAILPSGLAKQQTQIFVTNPAIFKFYENINQNQGTLKIRKRYIDVYFKGTIWSGMREEMYNYFCQENSNKMSCIIEKNNDYWTWRLNNHVKPTQEEIETEAFKSYEVMENALLCLCPKGNGNSSMRIVEALACGTIPVLINDFSAPFGKSWNEFGLVFDTKVHTWDYIYNECYKLINDLERLEKLQKKGREYFQNVIYSDSRMTGFKMYKNLDTVAFGFSNLIINKLKQMS
jgi:hypothetical protein